MSTESIDFHGWHLLIFNAVSAFDDIIIVKLLLRGKLIGSASPDIIDFPQALKVVTK